MKILRFSIFLLLFPTLVIAQASTAWESHFSFAHITDITLKDDKVYATSENAVFIYSILTGQMETVTTIDGLDGERITSFDYDPTRDILMIGYENGLLETVELKDRKVRTFIDITEKHTIQADKKRINDIRIEGHFAYISTGYGISLFNLNRFEFADTYYIGYLGSHLDVYQIEFFNEHIYAATPGGIKRALAGNPNLIDSGNWHTQQAGNYKRVQAVGGKLYTWKGEGEIQRLENDIFTTIHNSPSGLQDMKASKTHLVLTTLTQAYAYTPDFSLAGQMYIGQDNQTTYTTGIAEEGVFFQGTKNLGILHNSFSGNSNNHLSILPDGPLDNDVFTVDAHNHEVWIAYGDVTAAYNPYPLKQYGISKLQDDYWLNIPYEEVFDANDLVRVRINKKNPSEVFFTSHQKGLLQVIEDKPIKLYNQTNSPLIIGKGIDSYGIRLFGLDFDHKDNLWFVQSGVRHGLISLNPSGGMTKIDLNGIIPYDNELALTALTVNKDGNVFFATTGNGVVGYNPTTKKFNRILHGTSGGLTNGYIRALAVDLQDRLWIGSANGLRVYQNINNFFNTSNPIARQIIIMDGDVPQELLFEISVTSIKVDGANNKWISTSSSGVFYVSSTGQEIIHHFTKDNSPLPSNDVQDVAIDSESGKVYFATSKGLVSFRGSATSARDDLSNLHAFPNPVRPEYHGMVTISGLMTNTNVKITDLEGNLVFETTSQGGTVQWDTRAFGKHRVASGVYFIMANAREGDVTKVAKIMIIR